MIHKPVPHYARAHTLFLDEDHGGEWKHVDDGEERREEGVITAGETSLNS